MLHIVLLLLDIAAFHGGCGIMLFPVPRKAPSEMLLPIHSTTALMCEVVLTSGGGKHKAIWYKDGKEVGRVSNDMNAVFMGRNYTAEQPVPEVGFLVMSNITEDDEGLYWCRDTDTGLVGELFALKVAYVDPIPLENYIELEPKHPLIGERLSLWCPVPKAIPPPAINWLLNGEPVSHTSMDAHSFANGTLLIHRFSMIHNGVYECIVSNFAAKTSSRVIIDSKQVSSKIGSSLPDPSTKCSLLFRSSVLWFLVGCLVTSCSVLIYLLCALLLMRPSPRTTMVPSMWTRSNPLLGPGFRKVVAPLPDFIAGSTSSTLAAAAQNFRDV